MEPSSRRHINIERVAELLDDEENAHMWAVKNVVYFK